MIILFHYLFPPRAFQKDVLKQKLTYFFIFTLICGTSKCFMKAFRVLIKSFKTPQRSMKIKISVNFLSVNFGSRWIWSRYCNIGRKTKKWLIFQKLEKTNVVVIEIFEIRKTKFSLAVCIWKFYCYTIKNLNKDLRIARNVWVNSQIGNNGQKRIAQNHLHLLGAFKNNEFFLPT